MSTLKYIFISINNDQSLKYLQTKNTHIIRTTKNCFEQYVKMYGSVRNATESK